jgi:sucrose phosphorylase
VPHKQNISYFGNKKDESQMVYQFPLPPLVLHAFLKQDSRYITKWLRKVGSLSSGITFFNFLASHDGVGVLPAKGLIPEKERLWLINQIKKKKGYVSYKTTKKGKVPYELNINYFDALSNSKDSDDISVKKFIASYAVALSLQGIPGIYIHSLLGSKGWDKGVKQSGIKRRINREKLNYSKLVKGLKDKNSIRYKIFNEICELLEIRKKQKAFSPESHQKIIFLNKKILCIERGLGKDRVRVVINISDANVKLNCFMSGKDIISGKEIDKDLVVEPYQVMWIK